MTAFSAHKDYAHQTILGVGTNELITWRKTLFDVGGYFDIATGRYAPPAGLYAVSLSINVHDPVDQGKYYALVRKNGIEDHGFELLNPCRMSGSVDTIGTQTHGLIMLADGDFIEAYFHQSNCTGTRLLNGQPFSTWFCAHRVGDYVEPLEVGIHGLGEPVTWTVGATTIVDRSFKLAAGKTVEKLAMFSTIAGTYPLKIVRRNSAGNYDVVIDQSISHGGGGREHLTLSSPFTVPDDGKDYHVGAYSTPANHLMFNLHAQARTSGDISGNGVTMTEIGPTGGYFCLGVGAVYAA